MDIRSVSSAYGAQSFGNTARSGKKVAPEKTVAVQGENVKFSDTSLSLKRLQDTIKAKPEIRIQLVEEIKFKIKHNGYPLETNLYKAVEKLVDKNFLWHAQDS